MIDVKYLFLLPSGLIVGSKQERRVSRDPSRNPIPVRRHILQDHHVVSGLENRRQQLFPLEHRMLATGIVERM